MSMTVTTSNYAPRERGRSAERGISLVELVIAITVLAVGMAGLAVLFSTAIMNNSRSKGDTSGTMLTQTVLEKIAAQPANLAANLTVTDCNPAGAVVWPIATTGAASPGAGAAIDVNTGAIDFTQAYAAIMGSYKMQYVACGGNGQQRHATKLLAPGRDAKDAHDLARGRREGRRRVGLREQPDRRRP